MARRARRRFGGGVMGEISKQQTAPSIESLPSMKLLTGVLSLTAGSVDVIGFLGLGGLFTAHITGNLVIVNRRRKVTPDRRPKLTPLVKGADGSARPGGAGRGCAAGASAFGEVQATLVGQARFLKRRLSCRADVARVNLGRSRGAERSPWSSVRSRSQIACNASAVALSCRFSGRASSQAAY